jgi:TonB family protein
MYGFKLLTTTLMFALLVAANVQPQSESKQYEKNGVSFRYPTGWTATEAMWEGDEAVMLKLEGGLAQIVLRKEAGTLCDSKTENERLLDILIRRVAAEIQQGQPKGIAPAKTRFRDSDVTAMELMDVTGMELMGRINGEPATGEAYVVRLNKQFVSMVYIRADKDQPRANLAWDLIRVSLAVEAPVLGTVVAHPAIPRKPISGGVLNGKAIRLPRPAYPAIARQANASGTVAVQVTINESGAVVSAKAVSGHPLLQAECVAAAREAQFSPTKLCGEPVKVTGIITYNFVAN